MHIRRSESAVSIDGFLFCTHKYAYNVYIEIHIQTHTCMYTRRSESVVSHRWHLVLQWKKDDVLRTLTQVRHTHKRICEYTYIIYIYIWCSKDPSSCLTHTHTHNIYTYICFLRKLTKVEHTFQRHTDTHAYILCLICMHMFLRVYIHVAIILPVAHTLIIHTRYACSMLICTRYIHTSVTHILTRLKFTF